MIQIRIPTGRLTLCHFQVRNRSRNAGQELAEADAGRDARQHPDRQVAFKEAELSGWRSHRPPSPAAGRSRRASACKRIRSSDAKGRLQEDPDAMFERAEGVAERQHSLRLAAFDRGRILDAPMRRHRLARPDRAGLAGGLVADRDDEVELDAARRGEFVPALAARAIRGNLHLREQFERQRIDPPGREASGTVAAESPPAPVIDERLRQDAARRIAGAQEQDVVSVLRHQPAQQPPAGSQARAGAFAGP